MSEETPLTAGGLAPPPLDPVDPAPDDFEPYDDTLMQDFLQARSLAPHFDIAARLDAFAAAQGIDVGPSAADATQAAAQPNGGIVVRYRGALRSQLGKTPVFRSVMFLPKT